MNEIGVFGVERELVKASLHVCPGIGSTKYTSGNEE
jgi:hypothetical protein